MTDSRDLESSGQAALATFAARSPSVAWEPVTLPGGELVWAWFKPPHLPNGIVFKLPFTTWQPRPGNSPPTLHMLLNGAQLEAACVVAWSLYGASYATHEFASAIFDRPILPPAAGVEPDIVFIVQAGRVLTEVETRAGELSSSTTDELGKMFETIDGDYNAAVKMERQMMLLRKQLATMMNRMNTLNRDLSPDERMHGDRQDKADWQDARRWLREVATRLSRCIKQHDIGETSLAGKREWFEEIYENSVVPRKPFEGLAQAQREFEAYRKRCQALLNSMMTALADAAQEGERRATSILARIAAKVRQGQRNKSGPK